MIKVEKGIPIPGPREKYPWKKLKIGESFFIDSKYGYSIAYTTGKRHKLKIAIRKEKQGYRVWRIK